MGNVGAEQENSINTHAYHALAAGFEAETGARGMAPADEATEYSQQTK